MSVGNPVRELIVALAVPTTCDIFLHGFSFEIGRVAGVGVYVFGVFVSDVEFISANHATRDGPAVFA